MGDDNGVKQISRRRLLRKLEKLQGGAKRSHIEKLGWTVDSLSEQIVSIEEEIRNISRHMQIFSRSSDTVKDIDQQASWPHETFEKANSVSTTNKCTKTESIGSVGHAELSKQIVSLSA